MSRNQRRIPSAPATPEGEPVHSFRPPKLRERRSPAKAAVLVLLGALGAAALLAAAVGALLLTRG
jgi:hypothetical protein